MKTNSKLLINEEPLLIPPTLAYHIGLNEAIFTQQLHFWLRNDKSGKVHEGRKWIFNTLEEWQKQFPFWSVRTLHRVIASCREQQVVITANLNKLSQDRTLWYSIDYDVLEAIGQNEAFSENGKPFSVSVNPSCQDVKMSFRQVGKMHLDKLATSCIPETSTETSIELPPEDGEKIAVEEGVASQFVSPDPPPSSSPEWSGFKGLSEPEQAVLRQLGLRKAVLNGGSENPLRLLSTDDLRSLLTDAMASNVRSKGGFILKAAENLVGGRALEELPPPPKAEWQKEVDRCRGYVDPQTNLPHIVELAGNTSSVVIAAYISQKDGYGVKWTAEDVDRGRPRRLEESHAL